MKTWNEIKDKTHDASGIENPENYLWYNSRGVYFPVKPITVGFAVLYNALQSVYP